MYGKNILYYEDKRREGVRQGSEKKKQVLVSFPCSTTPLVLDQTDKEYFPQRLTIYTKEIMAMYL